MEKKSTIIVLAIAVVLSIIFATEGIKLGVLLSAWSGIAGMIMMHYNNQRNLFAA